MRSGVAVIGIVGVDGPPSCGVATTLDFRCGLEALAREPLATADRRRVNEAIAGCVVAGPGLCLAVGDPEQVGAEAVDVGWQPGLL